MKCAAARKIMALTREGELSPDEERRLASHLQVCPACSAERASFLDQTRSLEKLRSITPALRSPEANVRAILDRVRAGGNPLRRGALSMLADRLFRALDVPGLRYALAALVGVTVTGFVFQQVTIFESVSDLEARLAQPGAPRIRMAYALPPGAAERIAQSREIRTILERSRVGQETGYARLDANRIGSIAEILNSPESRWMLHALRPMLRPGEMDTLISGFSRNVQRVLTYSKGVSEQ